MIPCEVNDGFTHTPSSLHNIAYSIMHITYLYCLHNNQRIQEEDGTVMAVIKIPFQTTDR